MYIEHPVFEKPEDENAKIWRYMDFAKFMSLLDKSALFFPRADKLGDPFEGSYSKANICLRPQVYGEKDSQLISTLLGSHIKALRRFTAINSWHLSEYESAAMWRLYLKSNEGIAIQSSFNRLKNCFNPKDEDNNIYIGKVKYVDYERDWISEQNALEPFINKRKSYDYEQELRAVIQKTVIKNGKFDTFKPSFEEGIDILVDLYLLIEKIYVAPTTSGWLFNLVKSVVVKYGLNKEVLRSSLDNIAVY